MRGRLYEYSSCVGKIMLHGSETWPVSKENEVALQWAKMRMVRWICDVRLKIEFLQCFDAVGWAAGRASGL